MKISGRLPAGSVVLLKDSTKKLKVMGFYQSSPDHPGRIYDYCGCLYPEGYLSPERIYLFGDEMIDRVFHVGYMDEEQFELQRKLEAFSPSGENSVSAAE